MYRRGQAGGSSSRGSRRGLGRWRWWRWMGQQRRVRGGSSRSVRCTRCTARSTSTRRRADCRRAGGWGEWSGWVGGMLAVRHVRRGVVLGAIHGGGPPVGAQVGAGTWSPRVCALLLYGKDGKYDGIRVGRQAACRRSGGCWVGLGWLVWFVFLPISTEGVLPPSTETGRLSACGWERAGRGVWLPTGRTLSGRTGVGRNGGRMGRIVASGVHGGRLNEVPMCTCSSRANKLALHYLTPRTPLALSLQAQPAEPASAGEGPV